jgi:hypothetical protein
MVHPQASGLASGFFLWLFHAVFVPNEDPAAFQNLTGGNTTMATTIAPPFTQGSGLRDILGDHIRYAT